MQLSKVLVLALSCAPALAQHPLQVPPSAPAEEPVATREFEPRDSESWLGGEKVKLWGVRVNNSLMSPAVAERLVNNLDSYAEHGVNLISLSLQGTNGGFRDVDAGPNAFTPDGRIAGAFARRLEWLVREADRRGMVVCLTLMMPRKDELLRDEAAVRSAIEESARLLERRKLRNVIVNLLQEFSHPTRIEYDLLREPEGAEKKARMTA